MSDFKCLKCDQISTTEEWNKNTFQNIYKEDFIEDKIISIETLGTGRADFWYCPKCYKEIEKEYIKRVVEKKQRPDKDSYYLDIAYAVAQRGTCIRRNYGSVIVLNDAIQSTGYSGSPRGEQNCCDSDEGCIREKLNIPSGQGYDQCKSVHSEMNAIINAGRDKTIGATLYLVGVNNDGSWVGEPKPCSLCERIIKNSGILKVVTPNETIKYD